MEAVHPSTVLADCLFAILHVDMFWKIVILIFAVIRTLGVVWPCYGTLKPCEQFQYQWWFWSVSGNVKSLTVMKSGETCPFLTGCQGQECFVMWWSIHICAIPVLHYNFICISHFSHACYMTCTSLSLILSTWEHSFVPHLLSCHVWEESWSQPQ
jgi:hypothetical protein